MAEELRFDGRVAVVTGAGGGLGRAYARLLAARGAQVVVNDPGASLAGEGENRRPADRVVEEITSAGGEGVASYDSVEVGERIVQQALDQFGRIDIVINNAGILRDRTFHKMTLEEWEAVYRVHLFGAFRVTHAAWPHFRSQQYGRVVMTSSSSGIFGNFGQANYAAMKLGQMGLANTLALEGERYNIRVNTIAPYAGSRMTEGLMPPDLFAALAPERVAPLVVFLCHERCPVSGKKYEVGGNWMAELRWERTRGLQFALDQEVTPEAVAGGWDILSDWSDPDVPTSSADAFQVILGGSDGRSSK